MEFLQLDPRKKREEQPQVDLGIEDTLGVSKVNIDHHGVEDTAETPSACEQVLALAELPEAQTIATVRPDADSVTAMAVYKSRVENEGAVVQIDSELVGKIGAMDRLGPKALGKEWAPEKSVQPELAERSKEGEVVVAIARLAANFKLTMLERVEFVQGILEGNITDGVRAQIRELIAERDKEFELALAESEVREVISGKLVFIKSTHRFATNIGYAKASTVVAFNPEMSVMAKDPESGRFKPTGEKYRKYTICRYDSHVRTDINAILSELNELESGWGGRGDIIGSPQTKSSVLSEEEVIKIVSNNVSN